MRRFSKLVYVSLKNSFFILVKVFVTRQDSPPEEGHRCVWLARPLMVESLPPCQGVILADMPSVVSCHGEKPKEIPVDAESVATAEYRYSILCFCGKGLPKC